MLNAKTSASTTPAPRQVVVRFVLIGLVLVLIGVAALPALAQETPYTDPSEQFTATIPAGWTNESTAEYGLFTNAGVSVYLLTVEGRDIQVSMDTVVARLAPNLSSATQNAMGEFSSPSGTWTQVIYSLPSGNVGNAVAQSNGSVTIVLLVTADSMTVMQSMLEDANAILASVSIQGVSASTTESEVDAISSTAVPQAQGEVTFPELTGPYAVGRINYIWSDDSRQETYTLEEGDPRIVTVWIWYPAAPTEDAEIAPYLTDGMNALFQQFAGIGSDEIHSHAYEFAPALTMPSGYPVLVYSPGNGYNAVFSSSLLEEIASHGYIVVGIDHAYNALLTTLSDGQVVIRPDEGLSESEDAFVTRMGDVEFVIDQLAQVNSNNELLKGSLDLTNLGIWGHSFGGQTAAEVCRMDVRCKAVIASDIPLRGEVAEVGLSQPIMLMDTERVSGERWVQEAEELAGQPMPDAELIADFMNQRWVDRDTTAEMLLAMSSDAYRVGIDGTRHNNFTDIPLLAYAQPALLGQLGGIASIEAERGQRIISNYILAFFDTYLKGEPSPLLDGTSDAYPEVTFSRGEN